jgi:protein PhnA
MRNGKHLPGRRKLRLPGLRARVADDANGNPLADGDAVVLIKDLKVKGSSITLKMGTKVKSIRLVGGDHEVDCKMDAGNFMLKAEYLKKV